MKKIIINLLRLDHYHWYEIKHTLKDKNNNLIFCFNSQVGFSNQNSILDDKQREIDLVELFKDNEIISNLITDDSKYLTEIVCYLGHFKKQKLKK